MKVLSKGENLMLLKDVPKVNAVKLIDAIRELNPKIKANITVEDKALYDLGFSEDILCIVEIIATKKEINDLLEEVYDMEIAAYNYTDEMLKDPYYIKQQKELEKQYMKYGIIEDYLYFYRR